MGILVIGVVGPSGIGKSSIARGVAANIGARYTELERVEYFTTKSSPSYASRDAVSETPSNIDWDVLWSTPGHSSCIHFCRVPGFEDLMLYTCQQAVVADLVNVIKHESDLCEADPAAATRTIVVDHYLLLACPRLASFIDFVVFLSPFKDGLADEESAMTLCCNRRISRSPSRAPEEKEHLRRYYKTAVWPAFKKYTLSYVNAHDARLRKQADSGNLLAPPRWISTVDATGAYEIVLQSTLAIVRDGITSSPSQGCVGGTMEQAVHRLRDCAEAADNILAATQQCYTRLLTVRARTVRVCMMAPLPTVDVLGSIATQHTFAAIIAGAIRGVCTPAAAANLDSFVIALSKVYNHNRYQRYKTMLVAASLDAMAASYGLPLARTAPLDVLATCLWLTCAVDSPLRAPLVSLWLAVADDLTQTRDAPTRPNRDAKNLGDATPLKNGKVSPNVVSPPTLASNAVGTDVHNKPTMHNRALSAASTGEGTSMQSADTSEVQPETTSSDGSGCVVGGTAHAIACGMMRSLVGGSDVHGHLKIRHQVNLCRIFGVDLNDWSEGGRVPERCTRAARYVAEIWGLPGQSTLAALELEKALGCTGVVIPEVIAIDALVRSEQLQHIKKYCTQEPVQIEFVHAAMDYGYDRLAKTLARLWHITAKFPGLERQAFQSRLRVLIRKGNAHLAGTMCGAKKQHHEFLLTELIRLGHLQQAREIKDIFVAQHPESPAKDIDVPESQSGSVVPSAANTALFLPLSLPMDRVHFVDDTARLQAFADDMHRLVSMVPGTTASPPAVVGLDVEWKPTLSSHHKTKASIFQLATRENVYVLDLLKLGSAETKPAGSAQVGDSTAESHVALLNRTITALFSSEHVIKLGVGFSQDLKMLASSYPGVIGFTSLTALLDAADLLRIMSVDKFHVHQKNSPGLSTVTKALLGAELDKSVRCSNWELRPLTRAQLVYAANDAHSLVRCFEVVHDKLRDLPRLRGLGRTLHVGHRNGKLDISEHGGTGKHRDKGVNVLLPEDLGPSDVLRALKQGGISPQGVLMEFPAVPPRAPSDATSEHSVNSNIPAPAAAVDGGADTGQHQPPVAVRQGKSIAVDTKTGPLICILALDHRIDMKALRKLQGNRVALATKHRCSEVYGYAPGSMPPFGHREAIPTIIDSVYLDGNGGPGEREDTAASLAPEHAMGSAANATCAPSPVVFRLGGGSPKHKVLLSREQLLRLTGATVHPISQGSAPDDVESAGSGSTPKDDLAAWDANPKFLVSSECRRVGRWLRIIGVDTEISDLDPCDHFDELFARAEETGRVILTCNKAFAARRDALRCYFLTAHAHKDQVREVTAHFGITFDESKFMSICSQCNTRGFIGPIPPDQAREIGDPHNIPLKVFGKVSEFWVCKNTDCRKIYWEGSKYRHAGLEFRKFFDAPIRPEDTQTDEKW
eukprot:m.1253231 g.1253231  ORF g.1253231 m.1253231 type:complete len:1429 (+) comp24704_c1_seq14:245-4531(+)